MGFGKLKNGVLQYAPKNYKNSNGNIIVNFNKNEELLRNAGYKKIINDIPSYNEETEYIVISGYEETEDMITVKYEIKEIVIVKSVEEKMEELKEENNIQNILIDTTMLATDEIFTIIEPILDLVPQNLSLERGTSKMVDLYVAMIQRGIKTIEQVPERYREEVRRILTELEK